MCDRIAIIDKGNLVALDTTQKLLDRIQTKKVSFKVNKFEENKNLEFNGIKFFFKTNNIITASYEKNSHKFEDILVFLKENNVEILDIATEDGDLEDVFIKLTNS